MTATACRPAARRRSAAPGSATNRRPLDARLAARAQELLDHEIDFIANPSFADATTTAEIQADLAAGDDITPHSGDRVPRGLPAHLARLCEAPLLSADAERRLFRALNYLKFRANALRATLDPARPAAATIEQIDHLLAAANGVRDRILKSNMRLVISVVKKFVNPQYSFDEMLSDGIASLIQAVDKFDYDRGFRFSTYAYRAVARNAFRQVTQRQRELSGNCGVSGDAVPDEPQQPSASTLSVAHWLQLRETLSGMLDQLDSRERMIIEGRFALGDVRDSRTFQSLADELGVSKERVRQLEQRAVGKLQRMASNLHLERFADCLD
ncbi:MAG: sigma-70 family RNA polymerase sigma factor [Pirellulaceae bacterium]|nr:sigma-70 family RNA polymerase sigma factor [Pirellulaceae bacterium]